MHALSHDSWNRLPRRRYSNLDKNVVYGAKDAQARKREKEAESRVAESHAPHDHEQRNGSDEVQHSLDNPSSPVESPTEKIGGQVEASNPLDTKPSPEASSVEAMSSAEQPSASQPKPDHHKRSLDALAAAKERFLNAKRITIDGS
ncbi:uncharacterized protein LOC114186901 isoform X2 [Vigna unguiculata]|uniref:uncharacterized protein LOC114186901 isoform X2 n=1 Tax=Vigna unguiculata TaxID=3917 RepID=UPI001015D0C5|nr:uncharacterized protein LOC114186901 isoform X2 [Vigna unguiculata]